MGAESRVKALTGGDRIKARFMRQDFYEFFPTFKLLMYGNHKPKLLSVNMAIKRRMNMLPFGVTIIDVDADLGGKLKKEWPGILYKLIQGCLEWQQLKGLHPPKVVVEATEKYLADEDKVATWLEDRCEFDDKFNEKRNHLYADWSECAKQLGEDPGPAHHFFTTLEGKGYKQSPGGDRKFKGGLRLKKKETSHTSSPDDGAPLVGDKIEGAQTKIPF